MYPMNCITKQVIGDKESNARKTQAFVLEGKTHSVCHLQSTLQIFQNIYSSFAHLIIWVVWFLFILSCISLLYILGCKALTKYVICKFFFHSIGCHFILLMASFYYAEGFEFDVVTLVYFCSSCLCFWWLSNLSCLYFGKQSSIGCFICYHLLPFLPRLRLGWMDMKTRPIYILSTRDPLQS